MATFDVSAFINKTPAKSVPEETYIPVHTFADFGLESRILGALNSSGHLTPTPIQDQIIPLILEGRDVVGLAHTGTGKTAAFLVPLIERTLKKKSRLTLVLTPTRELAIQVDQELRKLSRGMGIYSTVCVGGTSIRPQIDGLRRKNHFVIGTPGRILDLIGRGSFKTTEVSTLVLDEADRMLDMGFIHDIKKILKDIPNPRESLFFSATMSPTIETLVKDFLRNPAIISLKKKDTTDNIMQDVVHVSGKDKFEVLVSLLSESDFSRVLVFGAMKHSVEKLSKQLRVRGISAESIHGNKSHPQRQRALASFKNGLAKVLVATDVAARGIHVDNISHVINYDMPSSYEDYIHRIGRTGRGDKHGTALTFVQ